MSTDAPDAPGAPRPMNERTFLFKGFPCTCGHPELGGTHRTDGPCFVSSAPAETGTPTPETDAAQYETRIPVPTVDGEVYTFVRADFARRLEVERDKANSTIAELRSFHSDATKEEDKAKVIMHLRQQLAAMTRERDSYFAALHECLAATGDDAGDADDFRALVGRESITVKEVEALRRDRDGLAALLNSVRIVLKEYGYTPLSEKDALNKIADIVLSQEAAAMQRAQQRKEGRQ